MEISIEKNSFAIIDATTRDNRRRILELAEEKSFVSDPDLCSKARADLTNPRNRLSAEISWLPCVSPKRTKELLKILRDNPDALLNKLEIEPLAHANLMASAMEAIGEDLDTAKWSKWILMFSQTFDRIDAEKILRHINEDRAVSGFPEITDISLIIKELSDRRHVYNESIKRALNRLPTAVLLDVVTSVVDISTKSGEQHAANLIDDIVDKYQIETEGYLQAGAEKIEKLIEGARKAATHGEKEIMPVIEAIEKSVKDWDKIAQPIQLSFKGRGIDHDLSVELGYKIRSLAIDIANEHGMLDPTTRITNLLKEVFAELPEFVERLDDDTRALENLFRQRDEQEENDENWKREITFEADVGAIFKSKLSISPDGISWANQKYPLNQITRVRWGGVRHSVNGIPTGTTYTIAFGDNKTEARVEIRRQEVYAKFLECLWKAVCVRLMISTLQSLKAGQKIRFGDAVIDDRGVELTKHKFLGSERIYCSWDKVQTWSSGGCFIIGSIDDKKCYSQISYINIPNTHVLESCISSAFKQGHDRISCLLD